MKKAGIIILSLLLCGLAAFALIYTFHSQKTEDTVSDICEETTVILPESDIAEITDEKAVEVDSTDVEAVVLPQKYLFLGDSTSTCYKDGYGGEVTSYVNYLSEMRTSHIDCKAIAESTYSTLRPNNVLSQMDEADLSEYDAVFMLFGVNDYIICADYEYDKDADALDTQSMNGALITAINRCNDAGVKCYVILPYPCMDQFTGDTDAIGNSFQDYIDTIKEICADYDIETIDFNTQLGISGENFTHRFIDKYHPSDKLQRIAAEYLNGYLGEDPGADTAKSGT